MTNTPQPKPQVLAIDVGLNGAMIVMTIESKEIEHIMMIPKNELIINKKRRYAYDIPKLAQQTMALFEQHPDITQIVIENIHTFPHQGVVSNGSLMYGKGIFDTLLAITGSKRNRTITKIEPRIWKNSFGLLTKPKKETIRTVTNLIAQNIIQDNAHLWQMSKQTDGIADAILIATHTIQTLTH